MDDALLPELPPSFCGHVVDRWDHGSTTQEQDWVVDEVPVAMIYNGISHAIMLASPTNLEAFGLGFSLTERIIDDPSELYEIEVLARSEGIELQMTIASERFLQLKEMRRSMAGRTGCGLCGAESLSQVIRHPAPVRTELSIHPDTLHRAFDDLASQQVLQAKTGAVHAAGWALLDGSIRFVAEDVGRHNALDKLVGMLAKAKVAANEGFAVVTSRASFEMVQKSAMAGIGLLAAVSGPTSLAIRLAEETGLTLVGFARKNSHVVYTHGRRIKNN